MNTFWELIDAYEAGDPEAQQMLEDQYYTQFGQYLIEKEKLIRKAVMDMEDAEVLRKWKEPEHFINTLLPIL